MNPLEKDHIEIPSMTIPAFCSVLKTHPRIYFGGFPYRNELHQLQQLGIRYLIDLTTPQEKQRLDAYHPKNYNMVYINFPIQDNFIPQDMEAFNEFIVWLSFAVDTLGQDESIYIHCRGGHGRSGMIAACLLCFHFHRSSKESMDEITESHRNRMDLAPKWRSRLCPSNGIQRLFVHRIGSAIVASEEEQALPVDPISIDLEMAFQTARKRLIQQQQQQFQSCSVFS